MKRSQMIFPGGGERGRGAWGIKKGHVPDQCFLHLVCSQIPKEITWCQEKGYCN